jgi:flagellar biosynthesis anti-sigma factor FlgM
LQNKAEVTGMSNVNGVNGYGGPRAIGPQPSTASPTTVRKDSLTKKEDQVEISQLARYMGQIAALPDIREEKVENVRQALAEGKYDVEGKLPAAIDKMFSEYVQE